MSSVSNITRQYANLQSRRNQKQSGGAQAIAAAPVPEPGLFANIFGGDKKAEPAVPAKVEPESTSILEKFGFGSSVDESKKDEDGAANAAGAVGADAVDLGATEAPKKEESLLQKLGITSAESSTPEPAAVVPEPEPAVVPEPEPAAPAAAAPVPVPAPAAATEPESADAPTGEKKSFFANLKEAVGISSASDQKKPIENEIVSESSESSESGESSESEDDDNDSDFKLVVDKMENLRKKYEDLKAKYKEEIKKKNAEPAASKDNTDFSNILASYFAIEGSLKQLKIYLKKHADKNGYPVEGLGLDAVEGDVAPEPVILEAAPVPAVPEVAPVPVPEVLPVEGDGVIPEVAPVPEVLPVEGDGVTPEVAPVPEALPVEGEGDEVASESDASLVSGVDSDSDSDLGIDGSSSSTITEIPVEGSSPESAAAAAPAAPEPDAISNANDDEESQEQTLPPADGSTETIRGGRSHFIQNIRKNKTHRHHKRRNRHQTLRNNHT